VAEAFPFFELDDKWLKTNSYGFNEKSMGKRKAKANNKSVARLGLLVKYLYCTIL